MMSILRDVALPIVASAGLLWPALPAAARSQEIVVTGKLKIPDTHQPVKRVVSIAGLDLSTPAGSTEMEKRVRAAVDRICTTPRPITDSEKRESKLCSDYAWTGARPQMDRAVQRARGL